MTQFGTEIDTILAKPAKDWTNAECKLIEAERKKSGRAGLQAALVEVRGGEKPPVVEE